MNNKSSRIYLSLSQSPVNSSQPLSVSSLRVRVVFLVGTSANEVTSDEQQYQINYEHDLYGELAIKMSVATNVFVPLSTTMEFPGSTAFSGDSSPLTSQWSVIIQLRLVIDMSNSDLLSGDIIQENFVDSYNNLTLKTILMLKWANNNCVNKGESVNKTRCLRLMFVSF